MYINYATVKSLQHFSKYSLFQQLQRLVCCAIFYPHFGQCCTLSKKLQALHGKCKLELHLANIFHHMHLRAISKRKGSQGQVGYVLHIYVIFFPVTKKWTYVVTCTLYFKLCNFTLNTL